MTSINPETLNNNQLESTQINYKNEKGFPKIIDMSEDANKNVYLKAFLINDKVNKNFWNIPNESIAKYATGFIGKPLISYPDFDHPNYLKEGAVEESNDYLEKATAIQNRYKIGEIIDVKQEKTDDGDNAWFAYVRMTDNNATMALKSGSIPFFVSPQVYDTATVVSDITTDFIPMHLAIVDKPAYGNKARVKALCNGSGLKCTKALRSAAENFVQEIANYTQNHDSSYVQNSDNSSYKLNPNQDTNNLQGLQAGNPGQVISYKTQQESVGPNGEKIIKKEEQNTQGVTNPARVGTNPQEGTAQVGGSNPITKESSQVQGNEPQKTAPVNPDTNTAQSGVTGQTAVAQGAQIPTGDIQLPAEVLAALKEIPQLRQQVTDLSDFKKGIVDERQKKAGEEQLGLLQSFFTPEVIADEAARNDIINFFAGLNLPNDALQKILEMVVNGGFKAASEENGKKVEKKHQIKSASYNATAIMMNPYGRSTSNSNESIFGDDTQWENI